MQQRNTRAAQQRDDGRGGASATRMPRRDPPVDHARAGETALYFLSEVVLGLLRYCTRRLASHRMRRTAERTTCNMRRDM